MNTAVLKKLLQQPDSHPLPMHYGLTEYFGEDYYNWDPDSLPLIVKYELNIDINSFAEEKLNAARVCTTNNMVKTDYSVFEKVTNAFTNVFPNFGATQGLHHYQIPVGLDIIHRLSKENSDKFIISDTVARYIIAVYLRDNKLCFPKYLEALQPMLTELAHSDNKDIEAIRTKWATVKNKPIESINFTDDIIDIQIKKCFIDTTVLNKSIVLCNREFSELDSLATCAPKNKFNVEIINV